MYSFGVLLCENCIRELPDPDRRDEQVAMVINRVLRALVRRCLQPDPEARPSMEDIIRELEQLVKSEGQVSEREEQRTNVRGHLQEKDEQVVNSEGRLREMEQQLANVQGQLQEKDEQLANSEGQLREMQQQLANVQGVLEEKDEQLANSEGQLREMEQQLTNIQGQLQEKDVQLVNFEGRLREMEQQFRNVQEQLQEKDGQLSEMTQQMTNVQGQLQQRDRHHREMTHHLTNVQEQLQERDRQHREMTQQMTNVQGQLQEKDKKAAILQNQVTTFEGRLRTKDQEVNELEITLSAAQRALNERTRQQSPDWVISRDQIQLTDKCLGRGTFGSVVEGKYCSCAVAVKQIYELILSDHNRRLFEREINIASRCRHPCLLQFIGATNDEGSPLFVTEIMESSLRALLEQRPLSSNEVSVISLDAARALNYLHQKEPSPIIHRDICSGNVLLWRQADQWRAKVSDYGTANFVQQTMSANPGASIYSAPETRTKNQTTKVCLIYTYFHIYMFRFIICLSSYRCLCK